jgi:hypothetical protein
MGRESVTENDDSEMSPLFLLTDCLPFQKFYVVRMTILNHATECPTLMIRGEDSRAAGTETRRSLTRKVYHSTGSVCGVRNTGTGLQANSCSGVASRRLVKRRTSAAIKVCNSIRPTWAPTQW